MPGWPGERALNGGVDEIPLSRTEGRLWLCGKHFIGPDPDAVVRRVGADAVVCLCRADEMEDRYPGYVDWLSAADPEAERVWFPIHDLGAPSVERAVELVDGIRERLEAGQVVLVHCGAGIGRAGTVAAAVLMSLGAGREEALDMVAGARPLAGPEAGAQAELLVALEAHFRSAG